MLKNREDSLDYYYYYFLNPGSSELPEPSSAAPAEGSGVAPLALCGTKNCGDKSR